MQEPEQISQPASDSGVLTRKLIEVIDIYHKASALMSRPWQHQINFQFVNEENDRVIDSVNKELTSFCYRSLKKNTILEAEVYKLIINSLEGKGNNELKTQLSALKSQDEESNSIVASFKEGLKERWGTLTIILFFGLSFLIGGTFLLLTAGFNPLLVVLIVGGGVLLLLDFAYPFADYFDSKLFLDSIWQRVMECADSLSNPNTATLLKVLAEQKEEIIKNYDKVVAENNNKYIIQATPKNQNESEKIIIVNYSPLVPSPSLENYEKKKLKAEKAKAKLEGILKAEGIELAQVKAIIRLHPEQGATFEPGYSDSDFYLTYESTSKPSFDYTGEEDEAEFEQVWQWLQNLMSRAPSTRDLPYPDCLVIEIETVLDIPTSVDGKVMKPFSATGEERYDCRMM